MTDKENPCDININSLPRDLGDNFNSSELKKLGEKYTLILKKAFYFNINGDYLSSIIYGTLCLWLYTINNKDNTSKTIVDSLVDLIRKSKLSYKNQLEQQYSDDSDSPQFSYAKISELVNEKNEPLNFNNLEGMYVEKEAVRTKFIYPNRFPFLFPKENNNVLFYGPPGTGKTFLAKASAVQFDEMYQDLKVFFVSSSASELRSKWEGGTEKNIASLFKYAQTLANDYKNGKLSGFEKPKPQCKVVIFLDEVETIAGDRTKFPENSRAVTTLLQQMDGFSVEDRKDVMVLASTNIPWNLDDAFVRRFSAKILVDLPDYSARVNLIIKSIVNKFYKINNEKFMKCRLIGDAKFIALHEEDDFKNTGFESYYESFCTNKPFKIKDFFEQYFKSTNLSDKNFNTFKDRFMKNIKYIIAKELAFLNPVFFRSTDEYIDKYQNFITSIENSSENSIGGIEMKDVFDSYLSLITEKYFEFEKSDELRKLVCYAHYLADITGPSPVAKIYNLDYLQNYKTSIYAKSEFGYSNSDLTELINEFYGLMASNIINSGFVELKGKEKVEKCGKLCKKCKKDTTIDGKKLCEKCWIKRDGQTVSTEENLVYYYNQKNVKQDLFLDMQDNDIYVTFRERFFEKALINFATTTGENPIMCNFWEYSKTNREPNSFKKCANSMSNWKKILYELKNELGTLGTDEYLSLAETDIEESSSTDFSQGSSTY
jgi:DNA polymerase III delta prime subunit